MTDNELALLRTAFVAARTYIHNAQETGSESQARYTAWLEARGAVEANWAATSDEAKDGTDRPIGPDEGGRES